MKTLKTLLTLAETTARTAGQSLLTGTEDYRRVRSEQAKDVKLQADVESEHLIRQLLGEAADYPIIGEEEGGDASLTESDEPYWIVDPLDGTFNYLKGIPLACVSIGLFQGERPLLGTVYDFYRNELFSGIVTEGFFLNGQGYTPQWSESIAKASLATGFPAGCDLSSPSLEGFIRSSQRFKKVRLIGSAALALAYVAAGRLDLYHEEGIKLWDIAGGLALVQAAGGVMRMIPKKNQPLSYEVWAGGRMEFILESVPPHEEELDQVEE